MASIGHLLCSPTAGQATISRLRCETHASFLSLGHHVGGHLEPGRHGGLTTSRKKQIVEDAEGEEYLHKETWRVVNRQFDPPDDRKKGATYDDLVAMVFAAHSLEGYLNFIGDKILPELWQKEREIEGGFEGKLARILQECGLNKFEKGRRPYSTVTELTTLRNNLAHPKTKKQRKRRKIYPEGKEPTLF